MRDEGWIIPALLTALLAVSALVTVASRALIIETHRTLKESEAELHRLQERERALLLELATRTDLNEVERRARKELGMDRPRPEQWYVVPP